MDSPPPTGRRLPNLLVAGVTKAGTTSLYSYLRQNPEIFCPAHKEINYYSSLIYDEQPGPLVEYEKHYVDAAGETWLLDASPFYFTGGSRIATAALRDLGDCRVVISLRDPVERLWSAYRYQRSQGRKVANFDDYLDVCFAEYESGQDVLPGHNQELELRTGRYAQYLPQWIDAVGPDRVRLVFMDDLSTDPKKVARGLFDWLGVPDTSATLDTEARNVTQQPKSLLLSRTSSWANEHFRQRLSRFERTYELTRRVYKKTDSLNARSIDEAPTPDQLDRVGGFYADETASLSRYLTSLGYADTPTWVRER